MKNRIRGFTLIEILLVTVIIAVIAGLSIPNFGRTYAQLKLQKSADDLAYRMRYAQSYAITKNKLLRLEFDADFTQCFLSIESESETSGNDEITFKRFPGKLGQAITFGDNVKVSMEDEDTFLYFYPDGTLEKRRIDICRTAKGGSDGQDECISVSTQEQRGQVHVFKSTTEIEWSPHE